MVDITTLNFDEKGLIPAIVVDDDTDKVLTLAYMNAESLAISMEKKLTCFYSRSRQELWRKGETSAHRFHHRRLRSGCFGRACQEGRTCLPPRYRFLLS